MTNEYATFPINDGEGNNITLRFDCYKLGQDLPANGIVILAKLHNSIFRKYSNIWFLENIEKTLISIDVKDLDIDRILVYECENNEKSHYYVEQIKLSKKIKNSIIL